VRACGKSTWQSKLQSDFAQVFTPDRRLCSLSPGFPGFGALRKLPLPKIQFAQDSGIDRAADHA
jgi:hypothetical protein